MSVTFEDIPEAVTRYIRNVFGEANNKVSRTLTFHPSMHEESLDHVLVAELTAAPPTFFSKERIAVAIVALAWSKENVRALGDRRHPFVRDPQETGSPGGAQALLQTKRLYSKDISVSELDDTDYIIGIGRIADRTDPLFRLSHQRAFRFESRCVYGAMHAGSAQVRHIDEYTRKHGIPVY